jgi:hypothetical protein
VTVERFCGGRAGSRFTPARRPQVDHRRARAACCAQRVAPKQTEASDEVRSDHRGHIEARSARMGFALASILLLLSFSWRQARRYRSFADAPAIMQRGGSRKALNTGRASSGPACTSVGACGEQRAWGSEPRRRWPRARMRKHRAQTRPATVREGHGRACWLRCQQRHDAGSSIPPIRRPQCSTCSRSVTQATR